MANGKSAAHRTAIRVNRRQLWGLRCCSCRYGKHIRD